MTTLSGRGAPRSLLTALSLALAMWLEGAWANGGTLRLAVVSGWPLRGLRVDPAGSAQSRGARHKCGRHAPRHWDAAAGCHRPGERGGDGNLLLYHATLDLSREGRWRLTVRVEGSRGSGTASFDLNVHPAGPSWLLGATVATLLVLIVLISWRHIYRPSSRPT